MTTFKLTKVNHIAHPISDRRRSLAFYRDVLGLELIPSMVDGQRVIWTRMADGSMLHLIEPANGESAGYHAAFEVDDFAAALETLQAHGYEPESSGERHDGQRYVFVRDPDGNRVELTTPSNLRPSKRVVDEWGYTSEGE